MQSGVEGVPVQGSGGPLAYEASLNATMMVPLPATATDGDDCACRDVVRLSGKSPVVLRVPSNERLTPRMSDGLSMVWALESVQAKKNPLGPRPPLGSVCQLAVVVVSSRSLRSRAAPLARNAR